MKTKQKIPKLSLLSFLFISLLAIWTLFSFFTILYNLKKSVTDAKQWIPLTDSQKKYTIFGDIYSFFIFINNHTSQNATILLYPHTEELFYRGVYELYPRKILTAVNNSQLVSIMHKKSPVYLATYDTRIEINDYEIIATFSGKQHNFGILYKRK